MGVGEAGHQHATAAFDHGRPLRRRDWLLVDRGDGLADDEHVYRLRELVARPIEDAYIPKQDCRSSHFVLKMCWSFQLCTS